MWSLIQEKNLEVILHVESLEEIKGFQNERHLTVSIDLGHEVKKGIREVDQKKLSEFKVGGKLNENIARQ